MTSPNTHDPIVALDLFAGSGWAVGARRLGIKDYGVEIMPEAVATREANGFETIFNDVWDGLEDPSLVPEYDLLIASPPCFTAGAPVLTRRGMIAIEEVRVGDMVLTHKGRWRSVTATMNRVADTVTARNITSTPDHPFWARQQERTWNNERRTYEWDLLEPEWIDAKDTQGSFLAIPSGTASEHDVTPPLPWWLVGRWLADGWGKPERHEVCIAVSSDKVEEFLARSERAWRTAPAGSPNVQRYVLHDKDAITWLVDNFRSGAANKTMPGWVLDLPERARRDLLEGYLSGDGSKTSSGWKCNSVSVNLTFSIKLLAESLGYATSYNFFERPKTATIEGRTVSQRDTWSLAINRDDGRYSRRSDLHRWVKQRKPVVPSGVQRVYDITVDEDHSFVCWGHVVHNCQGYSMAGKGSGRKALDDVLNMLDSAAYADPARLRDFGQHGIDERDVLVLSPLAYIYRDRPRYVALEQVPAVLPVWEAYAERMREWGYDVKVATLHAEQYGVPQTRKRAILVANLGGEAHLPTPTHSRYHSRSPQKLDEGVKEWVSMAEALGWANGDKVGFPRKADDMGESITINGEEFRERDLREADRPSFNVTSKARSWSRWGFTDRPAVAVGNAVGRGLIGGSGAKASVVRAIEDGSFIPSVHGKDDSYAEQTRITVEEAGALQSYPTAVKNMGAGMVERHGERPGREADQPAFTIRASAEGGEPGGFKWSDGEKMTAEQASTFQTYPTAALPGEDGRDIKWPYNRPSPTIVGSFAPDVVAAPGYRKPGDPPRQKTPGSVRVTQEQAATLQSFPVEPPFTFCGTKTKVMLQIGNAVPPLLATHILEALVYGTQEVAQQYELSQLRPSGNMATSLNDDNQEVEDGRTDG